MPVLTQFNRELRECAAERRETVVCTKRRAEAMGVPWATLLRAAREHGLFVGKRGSSGYMAFRRQI